MLVGENRRRSHISLQRVRNKETNKNDAASGALQEYSAVHEQIGSAKSLHICWISGLFVRLRREEVVDEARLLPFDHLLADLVPRAPGRLSRDVLNTGRTFSKITNV
jgi:hypothetical protein